MVLPVLELVLIFHHTLARSEEVPLPALRNQYRPFAIRIVPIICPLGFQMVHIPFWKVAEQSALSRQLTEIRVKPYQGHRLNFSIAQVSTY
jgi:hypothetical protein